MAHKLTPNQMVQIAATAFMSEATVRRAVKGDGPTSNNTKLRIRRAMKDLGIGDDCWTEEEKPAAGKTDGAA